MAKKKFYAWIAPGGAGIHETWEECQAACSGFKHERHKGFATYEEAWHFAYPDKPFPTPTDEIPAGTLSGETPADTSREDEVISPSQPIIPFTSADIPISEEVNQYCSTYGFEKLSDRQRMAVQSVDGKTLLFAVPGSGKTTVIIARTGFMVYSRKIDPNSIISLTFTKAAANEMVTRYKDHFKTENVPDFRTIHSLCFSIILPRLRKDDRAFLKQLEAYISCEKIADQVISPKTLAVNITGISLYQEVVSAGLRGSRKSEHWFSYLVMRKGADLF